MKFARQSFQPDWFGDYAINESVTSGTSPFNEWYGFDSEEKAHEELSLLDDLANPDVIVLAVGPNGRLMYYSSEDVDEDDVVSPGASPASVRDIVRAISRF